MNINPENIRIEDYSYELPDNRIAKYPLEQRDQSQLLVYNKGEFISAGIISLMTPYLRTSLNPFLYSFSGRVVSTVGSIKTA